MFSKVRMEKGRRAYPSKIVSGIVEIIRIHNFVICNFGENFL